MVTYGKYLAIGTISAIAIIGGIYFFTRKQAVPNNTISSQPSQPTTPLSIPIGNTNSPPSMSEITQGTSGITTTSVGTPINQTLGIIQGSAQSGSFSGDILFTNIAPPYIFINTTFSLYPNIIGGIGTLSWHWDFGDGTSSDGIMVSHTYAKAGNYTINLTVSDTHGDIGHFSTSLTVQNKINKITIFSVSTTTITSSTLWRARLDYIDGMFLDGNFTTSALETDIRLYTVSVEDLTGIFPRIY